MEFCCGFFVFLWCSITYNMAQTAAKLSSFHLLNNNNNIPSLLFEKPQISVTEMMKTALTASATNKFMVSR